MLALVVATHEQAGVQWHSLLTTILLGLMMGAAGGAGFAYVMRFLSRKLDEKVAEYERRWDDEDSPPT